MGQRETAVIPVTCFYVSSMKTHRFDCILHSFHCATVLLFWSLFESLPIDGNPFKGCYNLGHCCPPWSSVILDLLLGVPTLILSFLLPCQMPSTPPRALASDHYWDLCEIRAYSVKVKGGKGTWARPPITTGDKSSAVNPLGWRQTCRYCSIYHVVYCCVMWLQDLSCKPCLSQPSLLYFIPCPPPTQPMPWAPQSVHPDNEMRCPHASETYLECPSVSACSAGQIFPNPHCSLWRASPCEGLVIVPRWSWSYPPVFPVHWTRCMWTHRTYFCFTKRAWAFHPSVLCGATLLQGLARGKRQRKCFWECPSCIRLNWIEQNCVRV